MIIYHNCERVGRVSLYTKQDFEKKKGLRKYSKNFVVGNSAVLYPRPRLWQHCGGKTFGITLCVTQPLILLAVLRVARITIGARIYCKFFVGQLPLTLPSVRPNQGYDYRAGSSIRRQTMLCTVTKGIDLGANDLGCGKLRCLAGPGDVIRRRAVNRTPFSHLFWYVTGRDGWWVGWGGVWWK